MFLDAGTVSGGSGRGGEQGQHADQAVEVRGPRGDELGVPVARRRHIHGGVRRRHIRGRQLLRSAPVQGVSAVLPVRVPAAQGRGHTGQGPGRGVQVLDQRERMVFHRPEDRRVRHTA